MKTSIRITIGMLLCATALTAFAQNQWSPAGSTAINYYNHCPASFTDKEWAEMTPHERTMGISCSSYMAGVFDSLNVIEAILGDKTPFHIPDQLTVRQFLLIVDNYMRRHPEKLDLATLAVAIEALKDAYPARAR